MSSFLASASDAASHLLAMANPDDFKPNQAPVPEELKNKVRVLLGFVAWTVTGLCVAGVLMVGGRMAVMHRRGEGGEHASGLAWVGGACVLVGSAAAIVGAIV
ncbi:hypothetical protein [Spirillospora sp. NPDC029432]|uniref:hypothetical protein n=1 Tax=Spirillospora sp. NPDC029432 TaxID=3154599 RepID=UPI0034511E2A